MKHHYVPSFYLKEWAGPKGLLCEYRRVLPQKIVPRRTAPDGTGYVENLYRIDGVPEEQAHVFETMFLQPVDSQARDALKKMVTLQELTEAERSAFTRLMLSLLFRNPEAVADIKKHMLDVWNAAIDSLRDNYPQWRAETDPEDFADFVERQSPGARFMRVMNLLYESIDNPKVGNTIFQMCWSCVSLEEAAGILLTSDRPLELANGLGSPNALITMPLGPKHLFVASHRDSGWLRNLAPAKIVEEVNKGVIARARKMVWGVDDARLDFVREWMSREPDRVLISPLQKREAIEAARGDGQRELETVFPHHPA